MFRVSLVTALLLQVKMYSMLLMLTFKNDWADFWITFKCYLIDFTMTKFADFSILWFFFFNGNHPYLPLNTILTKSESFYDQTWHNTISFWPLPASQHLRFKFVKKVLRDVFLNNEPTQITQYFKVDLSTYYTECQIYLNIGFIYKRFHFFSDK